MDWMTSSSSRWNTFRTLVSASYTLFRIVLIALIAYGLWSFGVAVYNWWRPEPTPVVSILTPTVKTVEIPVETLVTKTVTKYVPVEDRAMVDALLAENMQLRADVSRLTVAYASSTSTGTVTQVRTNDTTASPTAFPLRYTDWRLSLTLTDATTAQYTLTQKFAVAVSSGVTEKNVPISLASLYEIGPGPMRTAIPITETTYFVAAKPNTRWYRHLTLQGGVLSENTRVVGVLALPWLKRGHTTAPADTRWAVLTPAVTLNTPTRSLGVFPVSVNLGTFPGVRTLLTNVWISPYLGTTNIRSFTQRGVAITVTF